MPPVVSTSSHPPPEVRHVGRRQALALGVAALALTSCVSVSILPGPPIASPRIEGDEFTMTDGVRLPYRVWLPVGAPTTVILALHGFNDSRDAFEIPAPVFTAAGMAVYAPDQRGFGDAFGRGYWPGGEALVADAAEMAGLLQARHPGAQLVVLGESMGGAVAMCLATTRGAPADARYVLVSPAVWGRARMDLILRTSLWLAYNLVPGLTASHAPGVRIVPSDNREALIRLSRDPLTIHETRIDTLKGLVDLMDMALAAAASFTATGLFMYGAKDDLVPPEATVAMWERLPDRRRPAGARLAYYADGYHLLLRDLGRARPLADVVAWLQDPAAPLVSGADAAATGWLAAKA